MNKIKKIIGVILVAMISLSFIPTNVYALTSDSAVTSSIDGNSIKKEGDTFILTLNFTLGLQSGYNTIAYGDVYVSGFKAWTKTVLGTSGNTIRIQFANIYSTEATAVKYVKIPANTLKDSSGNYYGDVIVAFNYEEKSFSSVAPTVSLSNVPSSIKEGNSFVFYINTTNVNPKKIQTINEQFITLTGFTANLKEEVVNENQAKITVSNIKKTSDTGYITVKAGYLVDQAGLTNTAVSSNTFYVYSASSTTTDNSNSSSSSSSSTSNSGKAVPKTGVLDFIKNGVEGLNDALDLV